MTELNPKGLTGFRVFFKINNQDMKVFKNLSGLKKGLQN